MKRAVPRSLALVLGLLVLASAGLAKQTNAQPARRFRIVVIEGEAAVNIIQQKTAVAPVVEVRDENDLPVAGVPVTFAISSGNTAAFAGGAQTLTVATNAAGRAIATGFSPLATGAVQVNVTAAVQGQTLAATITQTNFLTVAQAAQAGTAASSASAPAGAASGGGGGLSTGTITGIAGAAAAGAGLALGLAGEETAATPALGVGRSPTGAGVRDVTAFTFTATGGASTASYSWEFGDGASGTGASVTHTYTATGTFTVTLRSTSNSGDATATTTVTVETLTGTWASPRQNCLDPTRTCPIVYRVVVTQQGTSLTGRWEQDYDPSWPTVPLVIPDVQVLSGEVRDPRAVTLNQEGQCLRVFSGTLDPDGRQLTGTATPRNPICSTDGVTLTLVRQ